ncbi:MAG TPA: response regulator [Flavobacterium sp.]|jgi:CheY-like chemotaxis protein
MNKNGPILIIDDDIDDQEILAEIFSQLEINNDVKFFSSGYEALNYLESAAEPSFLIFSDYNMPRMSGVEFKEAILQSQQNHIKSIPFIFFTTAAPKKAVLDAYLHCAQGFFIKPSSFQELRILISNIVTYWQGCEAPL